LSIAYNSETRCFFLHLSTSFYALRVLDTGEVVHVGAGPLVASDSSNAGNSPPLLELDEYGDANYVWDQQARRWELPTYGDISYHDVALKAGIVESPGQAYPAYDLRLRYVSHEIRTDDAPALSVPVVDVKSTPARETLSILLRDTTVEFYATLYYRVTPEHDIIERWIRINNASTCQIVVDSLAFGTVYVPNGRYELTRPAGAWAREFIATTQILAQGRIITESTGLNTGHASNPFFQLSEVGKSTEQDGTVYFGALAYSGNWSLRFEALPTTVVRVHGGYDPDGFGLTLDPGESHTTPAFVHGIAKDGKGGASRRLHRFTRDYVLPQNRHGDFRPVLYNSWEAVYFQMSHESQLILARKAAAIGIELFCVDDGWFGGRRNDAAGLGDWWVSQDVFPSGLVPLIDEVKRLGMRFGLWVEPEMVNPDSDLYREHPDWVLHYADRPRTETRNQLILDFGRPEVVQFIWTILNTLIGSHDISFIKWDMNRYSTEPGSIAGSSIWWRHVEGVYSIMDRLRHSHPELEIQSCSGGGGRVDLGILARTDQVWTSDNTDAVDRVCIQDGFSLAYPPRVMESWVTHAVNHQTGRGSSLDFRFDVAMRGALGIGTSLNELSDEELSAYGRKIAFYKRLRPVVQGGDLYRLHTDPDVSTWLTVAGDGREAVYSIVVTGQLQGIIRAPDRLPGLISHAVYAISDESGTRLGLWSGFQLSTVGLPATEKFGGGTNAVRSRTLLLEVVS
jgi:alpha-galactosidase